MILKKKNLFLVAQRLLLNSISPSQRRHSRVKKWTKDVNIFDKDFIIIPINKNQHWYIAIICYPSLSAPVYSNEKRVKPERENSIAELNVNNDTETVKVKRNETNPSSPLKQNTEKKISKADLSLIDETVHIEIDEESYDEAESVNEENLTSNVITENENRVCTKM